MIVISPASHAAPNDPPAQAPAAAAGSTANQEGPVARKGWRPVANLGLTYGGVDLYTSNFGGTSFTVTSGSLLEAGLGGLWQAPNLPLAIQLTANYHTDSYDILQNLKYMLAGTPISGDQLFFQRYPLEGLAYYTGVPGWRMGGGLRYVLSPRAVGMNNGVFEELYFKNTVGWVVELGIPVDRVWLNFRVVSESYTPAALKQNGVTIPVSGNRISGSHIGINVIIPLDDLDTRNGGQSSAGSGSTTSYSQSYTDYGQRNDPKPEEREDRDDKPVSGKRNVPLNGH